MAKPGPQSKYTPERVKRITDALSAGNTRGAAAAYGGIDHDTLLRWERRFAEFAEQVKAAEAQAEVGHVANISRAAHDGTWQASAWWLERRRHEDWGRKDRVDITASIRRLVRDAGLNEEVEAQAVAEAEGLLAELRRAGR